MSIKLIQKKWLTSTKHLAPELVTVLANLELQDPSYPAQILKPAEHQTYLYLYLYIFIYIYIFIFIYDVCDVYSLLWAFFTPFPVPSMHVLIDSEAHFNTSCLGPNSSKEAARSSSVCEAVLGPCHFQSLWHIGFPNLQHTRTQGPCPTRETSNRDTSTGYGLQPTKRRLPTK